jgi:hypothetical protein
MARAGLGVLAALGLVLALPGLPAAWQGITHLSQIGNGAIGGVVVSTCHPAHLGLDHICSGTWSANDPEADPVPDRHVTMVNDPRDLPRGAKLGYVWVEAPSNQAFNAGTGQQAKTLALWLSVLGFLSSIVLIFLARRRYALLSVSAVMACGFMLLALAWPIV